MKKTKLFAAFLTLTMILMLFASCASTDSSTDKSSPVASAASADTGVSAPASTGTSALNPKDIEKDTIKIAYIPLATTGITNELALKAFQDVLRGVYSKNVTLQTFDSNMDVTKQISIINDCVTQGFNAIILETMDAVAVSDAVTAAEKAGVPVLTSGLNVNAVHSYHVQVQDLEAGEEAGKILSDAVGGTGKAVILDCAAALKPVMQFGTGFENYIKGNTRIEIVDYQTVDDFSQETGYKKMSDILTKNSDIDIVFCSSDNWTMGAVQAIQAAGLTGTIKVWGVGAYPAVLQAIKDGTVYGASWIDTYTTDALIMWQSLYLIAEGTTATQFGAQSTPRLRLFMPVVTKDNIDQIIPLTHWPEMA